MRNGRRDSTLASVGDALEPLSRRETQVFRLLILGHTNSEIAQLLHLSVRTVESHRANLQRKLALSTRAQLVSFALQRGLLAESRLSEIRWQPYSGLRAWHMNSRGIELDTDDRAIT